MILLTGATGYVGNKLLKRLRSQGAKVRCLVRDPKKLKNADTYQGDVLDKESLVGALEEVDVAYYLIHSMGSSGDFAEIDRRAAKNFAEAAKEAKLKRLIYLGGLSDPSSPLSKHLESRLEVGNILRSASPTTQVIELRASIVIGSGSLSFEMIRALTERLPFMITPKWVWAKAQPIAIDNLLDYLEKAKDIPVDNSPIFEIGGKECVSYADLMRVYGKQRGLKRLMIPVPVLTPYLSSLWLALVTPVYSKVGMKLIESACCSSVVKEKGAGAFFGVEPMGIEEAIMKALAQEEEEYKQTQWLDRIPKERWHGVLEGRIIDTRYIDVDATQEEAFAPIAQIGGSNGWYFADWLWEIRGWIDTLIGGVGMRRGRTHPTELKEGDVLDFWRVEVYEPNRRLRLRAEMKVPGRAWLEFFVEPYQGKTRIRQTAIYDPRGVLGLAYWYLLYPLHLLIFSGMLKKIGAGPAKPSY